jgi:cation/acetate symporter
MVLGIFWSRTTRSGAVSGMLAGLSLTLYYMFINSPVVRAFFQLQGSGLWFDIESVSAGVFGVASGLAVTLVVSLLTSTSGTSASS